MLARIYGIPLPPHFPPKHQGSVIANEPTGYSSWLMAGLGQKSATAIQQAALSWVHLFRSKFLILNSESSASPGHGVGWAMTRRRLKSIQMWLLEDETPVSPKSKKTGTFSRMAISGCLCEPLLLCREMSWFKIRSKRAGQPWASQGYKIYTVPGWYGLLYHTTQGNGRRM